MGLFNHLAGKMVSRMSGDASQGAMVQAGMNLFNEYGGLQGILDKFRAIGLGQQVDSWLSDGDNLPIEAEHIEQVVGTATITEMSEKFGIAGEVICRKLAQYLPDVVDELTPDGKVPTNQAKLMMQALAMLKR